MNEAAIEVGKDIIDTVVELFEYADTKGVNFTIEDLRSIAISAHIEVSRGGGGPKPPADPSTKQLNYIAKLKSDAVDRLVEVKGMPRTDAEMAVAQYSERHKPMGRFTSEAASNLIDKLQEFIEKVRP